MKTLRPSCAALLLCALGFASAASAQNQAPQVAIASVPNLTPANTIAVLNATVTDDGLPGGGVTLWWEKLEGPGPVIFEDPTSASTTAHFDVSGDYVLQLTARDGLAETHAFVNVTLNDPPLPVIVQSILSATAANGQDPLFGDRFLTMVPGSDPSVVSGVAYYNAIDPLGQKTTFAAWKAANGFPATSPAVQVADGPGAIGCCTSAVYGNAADLGFGRRMVMARNGGNIAYYVTNYLETNATVTEDPAQLILTVAMEYSALPGDNPENRYVKFYMYDIAGNRITDVNFDGRGAKAVPAACIVCHGGAFGAGGTLPPGGDLGAFFLPFDVLSYDFPTDPDYRLEVQEASLREMNLAILESDAPTAIRELIEGWYGGFGLPGTTQDRSFVPSGWTADPDLYLDVVARSCRMCHVARPTGTLDFNSMTDFVIAGPNIFSNVFGPTPQGFRMPHSLRTFERFWLSNSPSQPAMLMAAFNGTTFQGLGSPSNRAYVDAAAPAGGDGSSWATAYSTLSQALTDAASPTSPIEEIWVRGGTYNPALETGGGAAATFSIPDGVRLFGGFEGTETELEQRVIEDNETILSGDILGDDGALDLTNQGDNVFHVVTAAGTGSTTRLDGFTIRGGNAKAASDPRGGGLSIIGGGLVVTRCLFHINQAVNGGAIVVDGGALTMRLSRLVENKGDDLSGGIYLVNGSMLDIESCELNHNEVFDPGSFGGGIANVGSTARVANVTFYRNYANIAGGGVFNTAGATMTVGNSIFWHNCGISDDEPGQIFNDDTGGAVAFSIDRSIVNNITGALGGVGNSGLNPQFVDELGPDGLVGTLDEDLAVMSGSPAIDAGDAGFLRLDFQDLDFDDNLVERTPVDVQGNPRRFDDVLTTDAIAGQNPAVDIGAYEYALPALLDAARGTVGTFGGAMPETVFTINGSDGGVAHRVDIGVNQPFGLAMALPTSMGGIGFAPFALFMRIGVPTPDQAFIYPLNIGFAAFQPSILAPFDSAQNVVLTDNIGFGAGQAFGSTPAPWSIMFPFQTITEPIDVTIQGLVVDLASPSPTLPVSVTNGIVASFRENIAGNTEPTVTVDDTVVACPSFPVTITANAFDPDVGDTLNFQWTQIVMPGDPEPVLTGANTATLSFTAPAANATLVFELMVDDGFAFAPTATVTVLVGGDGPPVAVPGANQIVGRGDTVNFDGSGSCDPDGGALTYSWSQVIVGSEPAVALSGASTATPSFTAPAQSTTLTFQLVVTDDELLASDPVTVTVTVCTTYLDDLESFFTTDGTTPQAQPVCGVGASACISCHSNALANGGVNFQGVAPATIYTPTQRGTYIRNFLVSLASPTNSPILLAPLTGPGTMPQFYCDTTDSRYQDFLQWIQDGAPLDLSECTGN